MTTRKKLIEVALPLEAINKESAREKSIRHGHPSSLHLWWSRKPLATCRAVLFASLVDDPSSHLEDFPTENDQQKERERLFKIIEDLVKWENSNNATVLGRARAEILKSTGGNLPPVLDPFCGGGSIPLEAQRLGLEAHASDLNPVAVLIAKAMIEIPPKFINLPPINPEARSRIGDCWSGGEGLAEDVRYYGKWMRVEAERRIGHLYPKAKLPKQYGGMSATAIAWIWARTVKCPNPACQVTMPLVNKFWLSTKIGSKAWVVPIEEKASKTVRFEVHTGSGEPSEGTFNRRGARCICCGMPVTLDYIRSEGQSGRLSAQMMAIVAEGPRGRVYLSPSEEHEQAAIVAKPIDVPETDLPEHALGFSVQSYGLRKHKDLFTNRQLVVLKTYCDLISEVAFEIKKDIKQSSDVRSVKEYIDSVITYLAFCIDHTINTSTTLARWTPIRDQTLTAFARQTISLTWDYPEVNPFSSAAGDLAISLESICKVIKHLPNNIMGYAQQQDATNNVISCNKFLISTDPPYYDNIGYADLSDYFYIWLRQSIGAIYPELFNTILVPKSHELVANSHRFDGDSEKAKSYFENGLKNAFIKLKLSMDQCYPMTVYYAFKQTIDENEDDGLTLLSASTGWETMLNGLIDSGFTITGTWPMRSERNNRPRAISSNALASSIVLVCRQRSNDAPIITRRDFIKNLQKELYPSLRNLQQGSIAPVDLAQAAIGPGMAVFSHYKKVLEADGTPMSVRAALQLINKELDNYQASLEGELDADTRFCIAWFEQFGMNEQAYGEADVLARAKNTAIDRMESDGLLISAKGKVCLLKRDELDPDWQPDRARNSVWLCMQQVVKTLEESGENAAARLVYQLGGERSEASKSLAYRLFTICEHKGWSGEALAYNALVVSWPTIQEKVASISSSSTEQPRLFE
jgi:putative DNA methylase